MPPNVADIDTLAEALEKAQGRPTKANRLYIVTVTARVVDQEYHRILHDVETFSLHSRLGESFRFAFEPAKAGILAEPYGVVLPGERPKFSKLDIKELHIYIASHRNDDTIEIVVHSVGC